MNETNRVWKTKVEETMYAYDYESCPRGMKVREILNGGYEVPMPAYIDLIDRKVNRKFMFAEAAWIISGSNRVADITPYMDMYRAYSDDDIFMRGAYGPKVVEQLPYVADKLIEDKDSRQAVMTIWRERPGASKDIPCTVAIQFLIRDGYLHSVVTMRSNDVILGFTYDVFTFSMIANALRLVLRVRGVNVKLGRLMVNAGSLHLYENQFDKVDMYLGAKSTDLLTKNMVEGIMKVETYEELIDTLWDNAK